jgi:hypothetical protein
MLGTIWDIYQAYQISDVNEKLHDIQASRTQDAVARDATFRLEEKVDRLALICRAMFELLQASSGMSDEQLRAKIVEVDLRDGQADSRMTRRATKCPKCAAMMSPKFGRCLFCGYKDEAAGPLP